MSDLKRKRVKEVKLQTAEYDAYITEQSRKEVDEGVHDEAQSAEEFVPVNVDASVDEVMKLPIAKVMTNDLTPRCPFCRSARIQQSPSLMGSFNRWSCLDCRVSFRAPVTEKVA